jgi:hypothetical protein
MAITTLDGLVNAMANTSTRLIVDKASIANMAAGIWASLWRATGQPGQAAIPAGATVCNNSLLGAMAVDQQTLPTKSYLTIFEAICSNAGATLEVHDRLVHMGGLSGTSITAQNVLIDLSTLLATSNLDDRKGGADYSDVQWWVEWYTDTGGTVANLTANAKFNDGTDANLTAFSLPATRRAGMLYPLNGFIAAAQAGKFIRGINTVTLSISTAAAGSFGITATRYRGGIYMPIANARFTANWQELGLPDLPASACPFLITLPATTSTGTIRATGKASHG